MQQQVGIFKQLRVYSIPRWYMQTTGTCFSSPVSQVAPRNTVRVHQQDHLQGGLSGTLLEPHVSHVTFSSDGLVMATVDVRPNAGCLGNNEQTLRFWDRVEAGNRLLSGQEQPMYRMNTYLDDPHRCVLQSMLRCTSVLDRSIG